jgi:hypothetical protein
MERDGNLVPKLSVISSIQMALNASYCQCCRSSLMDGSVGPRICLAPGLGSGAVRQDMYAGRNRNR